MTKIIGVIGAGSCNNHLNEVAFTVGKEIAKNKAILVCGGLGGVMEAAAKGAKQEGGTTVGILPFGTEEMNPYIDIRVPTELNAGAIALIVKNVMTACLNLGWSNEKILERAMMAIRCFDPCVSCATHTDIRFRESKN